MKECTIILKENSEVIRQKIRDAGIDVCHCAQFIDACWLDFYPHITKSVHGVGYYGDEVGTKNQKEAIELFLAECRNPIVCKDVDEFISTIKQAISE